MSNVPVTGVATSSSQKTAGRMNPQPSGASTATPKNAGKNTNKPAKKTWRREMVNKHWGAMRKHRTFLTVRVYNSELRFWGYQGT